MTTDSEFSGFSGPHDAPRAQAAPLSAVLGVTVLGSVSSGTFWAGLFFVTAQKYGFSVFPNLVLATVIGAVYSLAPRAGRRLCAGRRGARPAVPRARSAPGAVAGARNLDRGSAAAAALPGNGERA